MAAGRVEHVTYFGTSPAQLRASQKAGLVPGRDHDLSGLRTLGSTGSTPWRPICSTGSMPMCLPDCRSRRSAAAPTWSRRSPAAAPGVPVVAGELSVRYLGVALDSWAPDRTPLIGEVGRW